MTPYWTSDDGRHVVYCGDCLAIIPTLASSSVQLLWTDPPYGHSNADGDLLSRRGEAMGDGIATRHEPIANDGPEEMRAVVDGMLRGALSVLDDDCCCCCGGGGPSPTFAWVAQRMDSNGLSFFHSVIWDKRNPGMGWRYRRQHEMVMVSHKQNRLLRWNHAMGAEPNIISLFPPRDRLHPNEKPVELSQRFIELHTERDDVVLDPFAGSGTTALACIRTGRRSISIEIEEKYCAIAVERLTRELSQPNLPGVGPEIPVQTEIVP